MPNIKIYIDEAVARSASAPTGQLLRQFELATAETFDARPEHINVMLVAVLAAPASTPVYIDINYRPNRTRTPAAVEAACGVLARLITSRLGTSCRVRATAQAPDATTAVDLVAEPRYALPNPPQSVPAQAQ